MTAMRDRRPLRRALALVVLAGSLTGCAHYFVNERAARFEPERGYRFDKLEPGAKNTDSLLVCLSFSGGGTRAAALAYSVLERLRDTEVVWQGEKKRLLDEVDCVSAVSGGSFVAAAYALDRETFFTSFRERVLERNLQGAIEWKVFRNAWWLWAAHYYKRSDLVAELYDETIFDGATFARLRARPFVLVNATDLTTGQRFEFTQDQFDLVGSDLATFPLARAVMASSAFPLAFSTITVRNHTHLEGPSQGFVMPRALEAPLEHREDDPRLHEWARHQRRYVVGPEPPSYLHLTDGGIGDNTGVRALWVALRREDGFLRRAIEAGRVKKLVVIQVNAQNDPLRGLGDHEAGPAAWTVTERTARATVNNYTFENLQLLREDRQIKALLDQMKVDLHLVDVSFLGVEDDARRTRLLGIPTELQLERADLDVVLAAGKEVLDGSEAWKKLLAELK